MEKKQDRKNLEGDKSKMENSKRLKKEVPSEWDQDWEELEKTLYSLGLIKEQKMDRMKALFLWKMMTLEKQKEWAKKYYPHMPFLAVCKSTSMIHKIMRQETGEQIMDLKTKNQVLKKENKMLKECIEQLKICAHCNGEEDQGYPCKEKCPVPKLPKKK